MPPSSVREVHPVAQKDAGPWPARSTGLTGRSLRDTAAVLLGTVLITLRGSRLGGWVVDDAAITFAYARSIDEGLGPVQQPGSPPVEGYSNPAWLALLVVGRRLGLFDHRTYFGVPDQVLYPKALGVLCTLGILIAVSRVARRLVSSSWVVVLFCGVLLAGNMSFVAWMFSGLENPLYALLAVLLAAVLARALLENRLTAAGPAVVTGLLALMAALTRPDGAVLAAAYPGVLLLRVHRATLGASARAAACGVAAFAVPYAAFLGWRYAVFARLVPNTALAKAQDTPTWESFSGTGSLLSFAGWTAVLAGALVTGAALGRPGPVRTALPGVLVPLALTLAAFGVLNPDWMRMFRFATPVWVLASLTVGVALTDQVERGTQRARVVAGVTVCTALLVSWSGQRERAASFQAHPTLPVCHVAHRYGAVFNEYAERLNVTNGTLLAPDLGGTLLTSNLAVRDLAGLTEPTIADAYAGRNMTALRRHVFSTLRPTFIHTHGVWVTTPGLTVPRLTAAGYVRLFSEGAGGDWVRADAVPDPQRLAAARSWAAREVPRLLSRYKTNPNEPCGQLRPGLTLTARLS
ncbi:hypothetical protein [Streptomyces marianii]|uniref:Glycosyltransferase RgtA/B/C/D-like domain-containing protein n=1 Tax=Streptomyces marianii TaxID=1817406 RepID=A0A5R9DY35_9ACTN|nr:hypothetical protein [Streptomyces marianii]TLQ42097.1 hypothetical protein FEF34_01470 [Streptomyces marianii]